MEPTDISRYRTLSGPRLQPDGTAVVFAVSRADLSEDRYEQAIWRWDGSSAHPFTHGPQDTTPRWSPDGTQLAFLRALDIDEARPQLAVMPADGGEARLLTEFPLGVRSFEWSPDGRWLVVAATTWLDELADLEADERARRPKRITRLPFRIDNVGWFHDRRRHLYLVDADDEQEPRCLTPGDHDEGEPRWRPDGGAVAFLAAREDVDQLDGTNEAYEVDIETGEVRPLTSPGQWSWVGYDPAGRIHLVGIEDVAGWPGVERLYRREGDGTLVSLTDHLDVSVQATESTTRDPVWTDAGIVLAIAERGRVGVRVLGEDGRLTTLVGGDRVVTGAAVTPDGRAVTFTATEPDDPGELHHLGPDGVERVLTDLNAEFRAAAELCETRHITFDRDGTDLDAWLVVPPGDGTVPVLLNIHGGPTTQYNFGFLDEFQVYASAGYLVVGCNPRGSSGRGREFARAVVGTWDELRSVDTLDLLAAPDAAIAAEPRADPDRVGVMGGSYGGYATARLIAADDRFRSAVVERGLLAWASFGGTSDIGPYFDRLFLGRRLAEGADMHVAASPIGLADRVRTPTLIVHSEQDYRCPIEQAEQLFVAYRHAGVETELLRFPDEGHELSRSGTPKHRVERFDAILEWHARHLP